MASPQIGQVSVIDTSANTVTETVPADLRPGFGAASHDGRRLYLADSGADTVTIVDIGDL